MFSFYTEEDNVCAEELEKESGSQLRLASPASSPLLLLHERERFHLSISSLHHSQGILPAAHSGFSLRS